MSVLRVIHGRRLITRNSGGVAKLTTLLCVLVFLSAFPYTRSSIFFRCFLK